MNVLAALFIITVVSIAFILNRKLDRKEEKKMAKKRNLTALTSNSRQYSLGTDDCTILFNHERFGERLEPKAAHPRVRPEQPSLNLLADLSQFRSVAIVLVSLN